MDLRAGKDVQLRVEKVQDVGNALLDIRHRRLELLKGVCVQNGSVYTLQVEKGLDVLGRPAGDDGEDVKVVAIIDDAGDFRRQADRGALEQSAGQPDRPGINLFLFFCD